MKTLQKEIMDILGIDYTTDIGKKNLLAALKRLLPGEAAAYIYQKTLEGKVDPVLEEKTAVPSAEADVIVTPSTGKAISKVTVSKVTSAIDSNIVSENIKKDVTILGVTGTYE